MTMQQPPTVTELKLSDEIKQAVNGALANGTPIIVAYVDQDGQPSLSFRGSAQAFSDDQLAIWVRNPDGGLLKALERNPRVTLMYRDPATRSSLQFKGRGRIENGEAVRKHVYESSPEGEQRADAEKKGVPMVVDLDVVFGVTPAGRISMRRQ